MRATAAADDLRRLPLPELRAIDFRSAERDFWADEAQLWRRLWASWAGLDDAAWALPGAARSDAGGPDWSLLEHVAHIEDWQMLDIAYVTNVLAGGAWPTDEEYSGGDFDRFNEDRRERYAGVTPADLRVRLARSHDRVIELSRRLSLAVIRSDAAWGWVFNVLHGHVLDHLNVIEPWVERLRSRQADGDPFVADPRPATLGAFRADERAFADQCDELLSSVPRVAWDDGEVTPGWTLRDHVGHLADWAAEGVRAVAAFRRTGAWPADPDEGIDAWNERMVHRSRGETPDETRARYAASMSAMRRSTEDLTLAELREAEGWEWAHDSLHGHVRKHLALIGPWAARRAWER